MKGKGEARLNYRKQEHPTLLRKLVFFLVQSDTDSDLRLFADVVVESGSGLSVPGCCTFSHRLLLLLHGKKPIVHHLKTK